MYGKMSAGEVPNLPTRQKRPGFRVGYARAAEERQTPSPQAAAQPARATMPLQHLSQQPQPGPPAAVLRVSSTAASEHANSAAVPPSPASPVARISAMGVPPPRLRQSSSELDVSPSTQAAAQPDLPQLAQTPADMPLAADPLLDWAESDGAADAAHAVPPMTDSGPSADASPMATPAFNLMDEPSLQVRGTACALTASAIKMCDHVYNLMTGNVA